MAYFKKESLAGGKPKKEKRASFSSFPKPESSGDTKPKKKKPLGKSGDFYEKKKKKPLGKDELPASRGFYKSKTGYNSPSAPWNKEKSIRKPEERKLYGEESRGAGGQSPVQGGRPKTFEKKGVLRDPTTEVEHENNPANYGPAKLQFRRVSKRAQRSFSKNKEQAYEALKNHKPKTINQESKSSIKTEIVEEKKKFMHGKGKPVKKGESRGALTERVEKPKAKNKPNPKPFKPAMPSNWRKVEG